MSLTSVIAKNAFKRNVFDGACYLFVVMYITFNLNGKTLEPISNFVDIYLSIRYYKLIIQVTETFLETVKILLVSPQ